MFGIDAVDLLLIIVLAVVMFGPEKLPEYSRKAARVFVYLRDIANNARTSLGNELGPEFANLELKDLNPKAFLAKHLREEVALLDQAKRDLEEAQKLLKETTKEVEGAAKEATDATKKPKSADAQPEPAALEAAPVPALAAAAPFDPEAT